jgi:EpsI family protein
MSTLATRIPTRRALPAPVIWACALMFACALAMLVLKPTKFRADLVGMPDLERIVPKEFGPWRMVPTASGAMIDPQTREAVNSLYDVTLERTYEHSTTGRRIMLSIAYGRDQSIAKQAHTPDMCYRSVGFRIDRILPADIVTPFGTVRAMRNEAVLGLRNEPLTYWIVVGDRIRRGSGERNFERMRYAARGLLVDGVLFRVSEITRSPDAFALQDTFIRALLGALPLTDRQRLVGALMPGQSAVSDASHR